MKKFLLVLLRIITGIAILAALGYIGMTLYMRPRFFYGTTVNGVDVSLMTENEARDALAAAASTYSLTITDNIGVQERIPGELLGLCEGDYSKLKGVMSRQNPLLWVTSFYKTFEYEEPLLFAVDEEAALNCLRQLDIIKNSNGTPSTDAHMEYDPENDEYIIIPETYGDSINADELVDIAAAYARTLKPSLDTREAGGFDKPSVVSNDPELKNNVEVLNKYMDSVIEFDLGDTEELLDCDIYHDWLIVSDGRVNTDRAKIAEYVETMAQKYDTYGKERHITTSWGDDIILESDDFGWELDKETEKKQIASEITGHRKIKRNFNYLHEGISHGDTDLGDSYVEVNMTKQHMYLYMDGEAVLDSDIVTGNISRGHRTPPGIFNVYSKAKNRYLVGEDYRTFVNYWMPFNKNIGLHDATWRGKFGGNIYKTAGSHGCVNLPKAIAAELYDKIDIGFLVICYYEPEPEE